MFGVEELAKDIDKFIFTIREIEEEPPNIKDSTKGFNFSQVTAPKIDDDVPEVISSQVPSTSFLRTIRMRNILGFKESKGGRVCKNIIILLHCHWINDYTILCRCLSGGVFKDMIL